MRARAATQAAAMAKHENPCQPLRVCMFKQARTPGLTDGGRGFERKEGCCFHAVAVVFGGYSDITVKFHIGVNTISSEFHAKVCLALKCHFLIGIRFVRHPAPTPVS